MTQEQTLKFTNHILRLLKATEITIPIGRTNKGNLGLKFNGNNDYEIMLDAVPLSIKDTLNDENNIELKKMIDKYWFEEAPKSPLSIEPAPPKKKLGRPKKVQ